MTMVSSGTIEHTYIDGFRKENKLFPPGPFPIRKLLVLSQNHTILTHSTASPSWDDSPCQQTFELKSNLVSTLPQSAKPNEHFYSLLGGADIRWFSYWNYPDGKSLFYLPPPTPLTGRLPVCVCVCRANSSTCWFRLSVFQYSIQLHGLDVMFLILPIWIKIFGPFPMHWFTPTLLWKHLDGRGGGDRGPDSERYMVSHGLGSWYIMVRII